MKASIGELKQRLAAITPKVRRYQGRIQNSAKTESFRLIKGNFMENRIRKEKDVKMESLMLRDQKSFWILFGTSAKVI